MFILPFKELSGVWLMVYTIYCFAAKFEAIAPYLGISDLLH